MEGLLHISVGGVGEPLQCLKALSSPCLFQAELDAISSTLERFKLRLPSVEMLADSGDLRGEHAVAFKLPAQSPVPFLIGALHDQVVVWGGWMEEGEEPRGERVDVPLRVVGGSVEWGGVYEEPIGGAFDDEWVAHRPVDEGGFDKGGGGATALNRGRDEEARDMVLVAHVAIRGTST